MSPVYECFDVFGNTLCTRIRINFDSNRKCGIGVLGKKREGKKNELARGSYVFHLVTFSIRTLSRFAIIKTSKQYPANNGSIFIPTKQPTKFLRSLRPPNSLSIGSQSVNRIPFVPRSIIAIDREKKFWPSRVPLRRVASNRSARTTMNFH